MNRTERNYGIDLMKALAMMMVVAHHIIMALPNNGLGGTAVGDFFIRAFHGFCYCAVDCFVMATGFIMCAKEWRVLRIFRLWRQVVGYSVALVAIAWMFFPAVHVGPRDWLYAFLPVTFDRYWFVTQYVALFFTIPYLNKLIQTLSLREMGRLMVTGLCILSLSTVWAGKDLYLTKWGYSYIWFLYLYLAGAFVARAQAENRLPRRTMGVGLAALGVLLSVGADSLAHFLSTHIGGGARFGELLWSYASPTILLEAVGMMLVFAQVRIEQRYVQGLIGTISSSTFVVYVVHSNVVFRQLVAWDKHILCLRDFGAIGIIVGSAMGAVVLYTLIVLLDVLRLRLARKVFVRRKC